jgi:chromosome partitioning protein
VKALVIASQKGGVGKTTLSLNLSYAVAKRGWRVLVVDSDPQGAIGLGLSDKLEKTPGLAEYIVGEGTLDKLVIRTRLGGLHLLVRGRVSPQYTPQFSAALEDGKVFQRLLQEAESQYDLVLIDTPCGFSGISLGAMKHADHVVSPVQAEPVALRSIPQLLQVINWFQKDGHQVQMAGFVLSMLQPDDDVSSAVRDELLQTFPSKLLFHTHITRDKVFLKASASGVPLGLLSRRPPAQASMFDQLALELEEKLSLHEGITDEPLSLLD